jgi:class 3 adenylate cyclase/tetratricopeptide (TPR) repeat protein
MICGACRFDNQADARFCSGCGRSLEMVCPVCGKINLPGSRFCSGCGEMLGQTAHPLQPQSPAFVPGPSPEAERKTVTVLFSDLSGYTAMSEKLDPEEVREITSRIFGEIAKIVDRYEGFVEKYIGDAIVALFGIPQAHEDDQLRAIRAARDIHEVVSTISLDYEEKIKTRLTLHTGITTGLVVTGEINLEKGTHGVAGDTINLASRLSGIAKRGEILVGESTYHQTKGAFSFEKLEPVSLKGKAGPVIPYRLMDEKTEVTRGLATQGISSPLVGRNAEIAALKASVNRLFDGQGGILSVIGEAGLGKSRLMAEIRRHFESEDLLWLEGRTLSYGQQMSYWPFREILWQYAGIAEEDDDTEAWSKFERSITALFPAESAEILPYLASLIGLEVKGDLGESLKHLDGESTGKQIYLSTRRFFERLASIRPLVLTFEDLHWADESTILLIEHLFPLIDRVPLLICGVSRPEANVPAARLRERAFKDHGRRYTEIRLNPLSPTECTDLMDNLLSIENLPARMRQVIVEKADGNPFFIEEIMMTLIDKGAVRHENGHWKVTSSIETITIPDTVQGVIMARIDRLDEEMKQVLKSAAVIGRAFLYRLLKEVAEAVRDLEKDLDKLTTTDLIREKQKAPELEYIFKHALVQESTYESILLKKRHELHGKVASAIETLFSDRLEEFSSVLAYHYAKAELWEKAQEYLFKAGDQAGRIAADAEALSHYHQALETYARVFGDKWDPLRRGMLERKMGEAFYRRGETEKAMEYLQRALVYFGRPKLAASRSKVRLGIVWEIAVQIGHRIFSRWLIKSTHGPVDQAVEEVVRIYQAVIIRDLGAPEHMLLTTLTCINFSERTGYVPGIVFSSCTLVFIADVFSLHRLAGFFLRRAVALAEQTQDPGALVGLHMQLCVSAWLAGELGKAVEYGLKGADIARRHGYWHVNMWGLLNFAAAYSCTLRGDLDGASAIGHELIRFGRDANDPDIWCMGLLSLGWAQERRGEFEASLASLDKAIELAEAVPAHISRIFAGSLLGRCYFRLGDVERSITVLKHAEDYRTAHGVRGYECETPLALFATFLAAAEQGTGVDKEEYLSRAKRASKEVFRSAKVYRYCLPEAMRLQGKYEWIRSKSSSAQEWWQKSIKTAEEMGARYDLGMAHLEMGHRLNDRDHLERAEAIFAEIGAQFDLSQTRDALEGLRT